MNRRTGNALVSHSHFYQPHDLSRLLRKAKQKIQKSYQATAPEKPDRSNNDWKRKAVNTVLQESGWRATMKHLCYIWVLCFGRTGVLKAALSRGPEALYLIDSNIFYEKTITDFSSSILLFDYKCTAVCPDFSGWKIICSDWGSETVHTTETY